MEVIKKYGYGVALVFFIALISDFLSNILGNYVKVEALTIAIVIGIILSIAFRLDNKFNEGINFSAKKILKLGIVLIGFKLNFNSVVSLGKILIILVIMYVSLAMFLSVIIGKIFKVNIKLSTLIGVGSSICGASAVVAMAPVIDAEEDDSVIAVSIVSVLGAIGVIIYSIFANLEIMNPINYGLYSGLTLHGVAHAIAGAFAMGDNAGEIGTTIKMARVLLLVPMSLILATLFNKKNLNTDSNKKVKFPYYVLLFILAGIVNTLGIIPDVITNALKELSSLFILMAITAMGLQVNFNSIKDKGKGAILTGLFLFLIMSIIALIFFMNWDI